VPADLHVHTSCSDSTLNPEQVVEQCAERGIDTVAITDHDTTAGVHPATDAGRVAGVRVIPGVELTAYVGPTEIHIVGLFIDPDADSLRTVAERARNARFTRTEQMVEKLRALDIDISLDDILRIADNGVPGRPHVAQALVACGQVASIADAFQYYLANGGPAYVPKYQLAPADAARAIHAAGGVSVVGHPGGGLPDPMVRDMIRDGVQGIEVVHPLHSKDAERRYRALAEELGVPVSGGSDCHGDLREGADIGTVRLDHACVVALERRAADIRKRQPT
jgi:predicted metal-dependent phosphoesterase TrpH